MSFSACEVRKSNSASCQVTTSALFHIKPQGQTDKWWQQVIKGKECDLEGVIVCYFWAAPRGNMASVEGFINISVPKNNAHSQYRASHSWNAAGRGAESQEWVYVCNTVQVCGMFFFFWKSWESKQTWLRNYYRCSEAELWMMTITLMFPCFSKGSKRHIVLVTWSWRSHGNSYMRVWRWSHRRHRGQQMCFICVISRGLHMDRPFSLGGGRGRSQGFVSACRIMRLLMDRMARILCQVRRRWASSRSREGRRQSTALTYGINDTS